LNNSNRGNNNANRRRGRGNNRQQGGGQQTNRIDSRARGNAPQMLEKFRKLAHDAHLNGDRVQAEYYLQFADHYFRVIADTRMRQDEQRARRDDRYPEGAEGARDESDDSNDFSVESDFPAFDQVPGYSRRERESRPDRPERENRRDEASGPQEEVGGGEEGQTSGANPYEPPENPFVRPNRATRGPRPRREERQPRGEQSAEQAGGAEPLGLDPSSLPPSIAREESPAAEPADSKPRRRTRRKPVEGGDAEPVASVG
jgi:hypothetical protein